MLTIAMDTGFQSIGPFNRAFKAATNLTPTEFRRLAMAEITLRENDASRNRPVALRNWPADFGNGEKEPKTFDRNCWRSPSSRSIRPTEGLPNAKSAGFYPRWRRLHSVRQGRRLPTICRPSAIPDSSGLFGAAAGAHDLLVRGAEQKRRSLRFCRGDRPRRQARLFAAHRLRGPRQENSDAAGFDFSHRIDVQADHQRRDHDTGR